MIYENHNNDLSSIINDNGSTVNEALIEDLAKKYVNTQDLKHQWKEVEDKFVKHKYINRYINDAQKANLEKHYANLCDEKVSYSVYKKSFAAICNFMGIPKDIVMIEDMEFKKDNEDKEQWKLSLRYSKGLAKVNIPEGTHLIHVSPVSDIDALIPSFRSRTKGKYLYPSKRVFFTAARDIKPSKAGLEGQKITRYTPKDHIKTVYIDPTCSDFKAGAVYVSTDIPIPVVPLEKKLFGIYKKVEQKEEEKK